MSNSTASAVEMSWKRPGAAVQRVLHSHPALSPAIILVIIVAAFTIANPRFSNPQTLSLLLQQTAVIAALHATASPPRKEARAKELSGRAQCALVQSWLP